MNFKKTKIGLIIPFQLFEKEEYMQDWAGASLYSRELNVTFLGILLLVKYSHY